MNARSSNFTLDPKSPRDGDNQCPDGATRDQRDPQRLPWQPAGTGVASEDKTGDARQHQHGRASPYRGRCGSAHDRANPIARSAVVPAGWLLIGIR